MAPGEDSSNGKYQRLYLHVRRRADRDGRDNSTQLFIARRGDDADAAARK